MTDGSKLQNALDIQCTLEQVREVNVCHKWNQY